ncbi:MAG: DUF3261 domain-containing protein [Myxococcota bacterium]
MIPLCATPTLPPQAVQVGLVTRGHAIAGLGIAQLDGDRWSLTLLSPAGVELFTVSDAGVQTGLEAWRPWLERLPVERDLRLAFTAVAETCDAGAGKIRVKRDGRRCWRGDGGPACAEASDKGTILRDRRRGYTLQLVVDDAAAG